MVWYDYNVLCRAKGPSVLVYTFKSLQIKTSNTQLKLEVIQKSNQAI